MLISIRTNDQPPKTGEPNEGKWLLIIIVGAIAVFFLGAVSCLFAISTIERQETATRCSPPVGAFSEAKLVGTWVAGSPEHMDTLIIRADGTYKQIVHVDLAKGPPIDYEGDWQPWHLEYSEDNIPYLHLTGMRFCGMNSDISCEKRDGDGYDFCQDESILMNGEGILIVLETPDEHYYYLHYPLGSENSYMYRLQEP